MESDTLYLLYIDRAHGDDLLFLQGLARGLAKAGRAAPSCLLLHGSGEEAERCLEGEGFFPERVGGLLQVETPAEAVLVERAVRETNRKLVALLTDAVVPAVGLQGTDRGLLRVHEEGRIEVGKTAWIAALARSGAVPVISALAPAAEEGGAAREVAPARAAAALAGALEGRVQVVFFPKENRPGLGGEGTLVPELSSRDLPEASLPEPGAVRLVAEAGVPVLVTSIAGLLGAAAPLGTRVVT